jgi:hypothetical protein
VKTPKTPEPESIILDALLDSLSGVVREDMSAAENLATITMACAAERSALLGQAVRVPSVTLP